MHFDTDMHVPRMVLRRVEVLEVDDSGPQQLVTVMGLEGEIMKLPYRGQYFGASGVPPKGSDGFALLVAGRPEQAVLIAIEHPDHRRRNMGDGEKVLYNAHGDVIFLYKEKIKSVTKTYEVQADTIILKGNIQHTGDMATSGVHTDKNGVGLHVP